jgi:hypothetical protein
MKFFFIKKKKKKKIHNFKLFFRSFFIFFSLFFSFLLILVVEFVSIWCRFNVSYNKNILRDFYWRVNKIKLRRCLLSQQLSVEIVLRWRFNRELNRTRFWRERNRSTKNCHLHELLRWKRRCKSQNRVHCVWNQKSLILDKSKRIEISYDVNIVSNHFLKHN